MPGVHRLAAEFGVHRKTAEEALRQLERKGILIPQGAGRRRRIEVPEGLGSPSLKVAVLVGEAGDLKDDPIVEVRHHLTEAGHSLIFPESWMARTEMKESHLTRVVERNDARAWVVYAGSHEVLEWFAAQAVPAFALFGRMQQLRIAGVGPDKVPAIMEATRKLIGLGHVRIAMLVRLRRRLPKPGTLEQAFLDELSAHGLPVGAYNLPSWKETGDGFQAGLDSLFRTTPPTALIVDETSLFLAAQQFLAQKRLRVPEDVSLICTDPDPGFNWCRPTIAHIRWEMGPVVRRIGRWVENVGRRKRDFRQTFPVAEFIPGGTIGPAPR